jgi:putative tricarboxylic transport membrane protein
LLSAVCAVILIVKGLASRAQGGERSRWVEFDAWTRSRRHVVAFFAVVGVNVIYIALVDTLGLHPYGCRLSGHPLCGLPGPAKWIPPLALAITLIIHYAFYKLLRVPLPWGLLQGIAW